jgi:hypothetical protein
MLARNITIPLYDSVLLMVATESTAWIIDGDCTKHIGPSLSELTTITDRDPQFSTVSVANKERLPITATGSVTFDVASSSSKCVPMTLTNVLVVPGIASRLFSCRWGFERDGIKTQLNSECCLVLPNSTRIPFTKHGPHYAVHPCGDAYIASTDDELNTALVASERASADL